jgi:cytochrome c oxidase subunit II
MRLPRVLAAGAALATACFASLVSADPIPETTIWGLPRDVSAEGHRIDSLINVTNGFVALLFVIMCAWMGYAVYKHNTKHDAEYDHGDSKHHVAVAMGISALIFFVVDGNLWFNSTIDVNTTFWNHTQAERDPNAVKIEINAHQWAWDARYAGPDGKFNTPDDVVTLNDIRVPKGQPIVFQIASVDVIHSFYLPNLRIKQDAMPGMINRMWFTATESGEFDIGCAQHCGVHHYKMKARLTVLEPAEYKRWAAEMSAQHAKGYDANDTGGNWGWDWKEPTESSDTRGGA